MIDYIKLMRPKHYLKNFLIFLPLIFNGSLFVQKDLILTFIGYVCFCLLASVVYIINDINDKEKDRNHKTKRHRPIASGRVTVRQAMIEIFLLLCLLIVIVIEGHIPLSSVVLLLLYFILNVGYSFGLKNIPLLDVILLVSGFLLRGLYGASLLNITISNWLYLTVMGMSFYLGLGKRRNELKSQNQNTRNVLKYYTTDFLDKNMYMFLTMTIVFYALWTTDKQIVFQNNNQLIWTVPLIIIICMKYSMTIEDKSDGDPVEVVFKDKILLSLIILYAIIVFLIIYI